MRKELARSIVLLVVGLAAGVGLGWRLFTPAPAPIETPAPEVRQGDGSVVLERAPDPAAKPAHEIPRGGTVERQVSVTVRPTPVRKPDLTTSPAGSPIVKPAGPTPSPAHHDEAGTPPVHRSDAGAQTDTIVCPDVTVDLSLVRMPDRTRRVIASARGGAILGGLDIPVEPATATARARPWAAGVVYDPNARSLGGFLDRDLGPLRVGAAVVQSRPVGVPIPPRWDLQLKAGWRW